MKSGAGSTQVIWALTRLEQRSLQTWMHCNKLKLNGDKTEVLCSGSRHSLSRVSQISLRLNGSKIPFKGCIKHVGVHLAVALSVRDQVSSAFLRLHTSNSGRHSQLWHSLFIKTTTKNLSKQTCSKKLSPFKNGSNVSFVVVVLVFCLLN